MPTDPSCVDHFAARHNGPTEEEIARILEHVGCSSLDELVDQTIPPCIRLDRPLDLPEAMTEQELLARSRELAGKNRLYRSYVGMGYHHTASPPAIRRNILEHPGWYTQYTPYQAEISQGRLEALLNFQTIVIDLTGLEIANASLLDESTAAAEAMTMLHRNARRPEARRFLIDVGCHPQTIRVVETRARPLGIDVVVGDYRTFASDATFFGVLVQYPATDGAIHDYANLCTQARVSGTGVVVAADLLSLTLLTPPGEFGADVAVGTTQRFGMPLGYGGPHAAYFATRERFKRKIPGRIIGVSVDANGDRALRMALQTREQHIRRAKATSNICTAQVLPAIMAGTYAVYHGPEGLRRIAERIHGHARQLARGLRLLGHGIRYEDFFDTLRVDPGWPGVETILQESKQHRVNLRRYDDGSLGIALDETVGTEQLDTLLAIFGGGGRVQHGAGGNGACGAGENGGDVQHDADGIESGHPRLNADHGDDGGHAGTKPGPPDPGTGRGYSGPMRRTTPYLEHPVFHRYRTETEMMRYLHRLASRDLSLTTSMIPLGSCTMKLNAAAELLPITLEGFSDLHPFAPVDQAQGYRELIGELDERLREITGLSRTFFQPNSGASGEYTGLLLIRAWHEHRGESHRNVCLIPQSAHGTNPASACMAGMNVVVIRTDERGNLDLDHLRALAEAHANDLGALMITYPSTHGVFEENIRKIVDVVHDHGGQVYMDGANMNAQVGLCRPGDFGMDVCHLNLHKTFCIPHGGGGPGMGPICVAEHLVPFLPDAPLDESDSGEARWADGATEESIGTTSAMGTGSAKSGMTAIGPVSSAPYGSANILVISWAYLAMMGARGLERASQLAILNANYMMTRLEASYPILYKGIQGRCAHEFLLDLRPFRQTAGISEHDVAKRLMDYGFHAPTVSFPVVGTMMIEPTESESMEEMDRFCEALECIRQEILEIERGKVDPKHNVLKNAPHTAEMVVSDNWPYPYGREKAAFPTAWTRTHKFWPSVRRINESLGDRNLICSCPR